MALQSLDLDLDTLWFDDIWSAIERLAPESQLLVLGGRRSRQSMVALSWDEVPWSEFLNAQTGRPPRRTDQEGWTTGHLAIVAYDEGPVASWPSRVFRIKRSLVIDSQQRRAVIYQEKDWDHCQQQVDWTLRTAAPCLNGDQLPRWKSSWTDTRYLDAVREVLEDIRRGRYYQLNLLRYWATAERISRRQWLAQLSRMGGPYSAYIDVPGLQLVSFSPERFFRLSPDPAGLVIETEPIKGTRPVAADPEEDRRQQAELMSSSKDAAELNMIVDLLRNDLFRVCQPSSVKVLDPGSLHSFANVHHRIARIEGRLRPGLSMGMLLQALCPGGSITGAPKREVMLAIREKEERPRGFFMGNIVYNDAWTGCLDSSILIRTAVHREQWEFAAGSGLVIHSDPVAELEEIRTKARVMPGEFV
jgi:anthranilate/para-aminobenzoate synthase component I